VIPDPQDVDDRDGSGGLLPGMEPVDAICAGDRWLIGWPLGRLRRVRRGWGRGARARGGRIGRRWAGRARRQWVGHRCRVGVGSRTGQRGRLGVGSRTGQRGRLGVGSRTGHRRTGTLSVGLLPIVPPHRTLRSFMTHLSTLRRARSNGSLAPIQQAGGWVSGSSGVNLQPFRRPTCFERPVKTHPWTV
jgi:hypothetical protein